MIHKKVKKYLFEKRKSFKKKLLFLKTIGSLPLQFKIFLINIYLYFGEKKQALVKRVKVAFRKLRYRKHKVFRGARKAPQAAPPLKRQPVSVLKWFRKKEEIEIRFGEEISTPKIEVIDHSSSQKLKSVQLEDQGNEDQIDTIKWKENKKAKLRYFNFLRIFDITYQFDRLIKKLSQKSKDNNSGSVPAPVERNQGNSTDVSKPTIESIETNNPIYLRDPLAENQAGPKSSLLRYVSVKFRRWKSQFKPIRLIPFVSLKTKVLVVFSTLPILSIAVITIMSIEVFKEDKLSFVYDSLLTTTRIKGSSFQSKVQTYQQSLQAMTANYDLKQKMITENGKTFFNNEQSLKFFSNYKWDGEKFESEFQISKDYDFNDAEIEKINSLLSEAWYSGFTVGFSEQYPMGVYLISASNSEDKTLTLIMFDNPDVFSIFGKNQFGVSLLIHPARGVLIGEQPQSVLRESILKSVREEKLPGGVVKNKVEDETMLISYSQVGVSNLYVVSFAKEKQALMAMRTMIKRTLLFIGIIMTMLLTFGTFAANILTKALRGLAEATALIREGDFSVRVEKSSKDEIGQLSESFNQMAGEISRLMDETAENARMQSELKTAHTVQDTLFPEKSAKLGPITLYGDSVPATECGGDWWHYSQIGDDVYVWIGDATGHGVPAALLTSAARAVASVIEGLSDLSPAKALEIMNKAIYSTSKGEMMMTFFIIKVDVKTGKLTYANASHDPPYFLKHSPDKVNRKDFQPMMDVRSPRLGENPNSQYENFEMTIEPLDKIFLYTDGVVDVRTQKGDFFGERRFLKSLAKYSKKSSAEAVRLIFDEINHFRLETPLEDDVTLVVVEFSKNQKQEAA